ncbi:MAG: YdbH domain-containing protein [Thioalkalispiraceae bacterium]|jgi:hypothetical protein
MSRQKRIYFWLASVIAVFVTIYAFSPWLLSGLIKHNLSGYGISDVELKIGYPGWQRVHLSSISLRTVTTTQQLMVKVEDIEIIYHTWELLSGRLSRVHIPQIDLQVDSITTRPASNASAAEIPLAALVSGQWLAQVPIRVLRVENLNANVRMQGGQTYKAQFNVDLQDKSLRVNGTLQASSFPQQLMLSVTTQQAGISQLVIHTRQNQTSPLLDLQVKSVTHKGDVTTLNGVLESQLDQLIAFVAPGLNADLNSILSGKITSQWVGKFTTSPQVAHVDATLHLAEQAIALQINGQYQFAANQARADFKLLPLVFSKSSQVLSQLVKDWPYPFDVNDGTISALGHFRWQNDISLQSVIKIKNLAGNYKKITFTGLNTELPLIFERQLRTSREARLAIELVDIGFPVVNTNLKFSLSPSNTAALPLIQIKEFKAGMLGGTISSSNEFELDFSRDVNEFVVKLDHIALNEIIQLEQQDGIQGSGVLDGQIPIQITDKELLVNQGQLSARPPGGVIRYTPTPRIAALAESNTSIGLMVKALSNFQYNVLDVNSDYKPGGDLDLKVRLEGHNPDWQSGRPVNLNLNLHENIPVLLRSLQVGDEISEQVRKRYKNSP